MSLAVLGAALPAWRRLAALVAGRAGFRMAQWVSGVGLVAAWGPALFATYATALAGSAWLHVLVSAGTEKALLALGPRPGGERLPRLLVTASLVPHAAGLVALGLALSGLSVLGRNGVLWAAAGAYSTGVGLVIVLIAVLRLGGRPGWDPLGVGVLAAAHLLAVPVTYLTEAPPPAVLAGVALASTAAAALLLSQVVRDPAWRPAGDGPRPRAVFVLSTVAYLGATEIGSLVATALVYRELAVSPNRGDASWLYLALVLSGALVALVVYLTRLAAPHLAREVEAEGPSAALAQGRSVFGRTALAAAIAVLLVVPAAALVPDAGPARLAAFAGALLACVLAEACVLYGGYWTEVADADGRRACAIAAVAGLVTVGVAAHLLVPLGGAVGALAALLAGFAVQSATAATLLR